MSDYSFSSLGHLLLDTITESTDTSIRNVYCDMDGVLVNFIGGFRRIYPALKTEYDVDQFLSNPKHWYEIAKDHSDLFATLPMLPDAPQLMSALKTLERRQRINLFILTALPSQLLHGRAANDKRLWMKTHFGISPRQVIVCQRPEKARYAMVDKVDGRPQSILIDDFYKNIYEWEPTGIGIHHKSATRSLIKLKQALAGQEM